MEKSIKSAVAIVVAFREVYPVRLNNLHAYTCQPDGKGLLRRSSPCL